MKKLHNTHLIDIEKNLNAYLDNELDTKLKQRFEASLQQNSKLQTKLADLCEISSYLQTNSNDESICHSIKVAVRQAKMARRRVPLLWLRWALPATASFFLGLVFIVYYFYSPTITPNDLYAQYQAAFDDVLAYTEESYE